MRCFKGVYSDHYLVSANKKKGLLKLRRSNDRITTKAKKKIIIFRNPTKMKERSYRTRTEQKLQKLEADEQVNYKWQIHYTSNIDSSPNNAKSMRVPHLTI